MTWDFGRAINVAASLFVSSRKVSETNWEVNVLTLLMEIILTETDWFMKMEPKWWRQHREKKMKDKQIVWKADLDWGGLVLGLARDQKFWQGWGWEDCLIEVHLMNEGKEGSSFIDCAFAISLTAIFKIYSWHFVSMPHYPYCLQHLFLLLS